MFKEICTLISGLTGFALDVKLQVGHLLQSAPERYVLVQETGGEANFYCPDMKDMLIQVLCHSETYFEAREDAYAVFEAIHGTSGWNLPGIGGNPDYLAMTVEALAVPQYLGVDDNRRHIFSTNYIWRMEEGSCKEFVSGSP